MVKNGIRGVYHSVSSKYLQNYLDEYAFRYNHRKQSTPMFFHSYIGRQFKDSIFVLFQKCNNTKIESLACRMVEIY